MGVKAIARQALLQSKSSVEGWVDGWVGVKAVFYFLQQSKFFDASLERYVNVFVLFVLRITPLPMDPLLIAKMRFIENLYGRDGQIKPNRWPNICCLLTNTFFVGLNFTVKSD